MFIADGHGRFFEVNNSACLQLGYSRDELLRLSVLDISAITKSGFLVLQEKINTERLLRYETSHRRKDGTILHVELVVTGIQYEGQRALLGVARDIAERKRAEEALRVYTRQLEAIRVISTEIAREMDLEKLLELILRRAMDLVGGTGGAILIWNEARQHLEPGPHIGDFVAIPRSPIRPGEGMVGRVAATRKGLFVNDYQAWEGARPALRHLPIRSGMAEPLVFRGTLIGVVNVGSSSEQKRFSEQDATLLRLLADQASVAIMNAQLYSESRRELVERRRTEEALRIEKERFQTLSEEAPLGMVLIEDGTFRYMNSKFRELFGYELTDVPDGKTWFRKAYPDPAYRHHVIETWFKDLEICKRGEKRPEVFKVTCKDGTEKIINFIPVQLTTGENLMVCEDITERKQAEEALRESEQRLNNILQGSPIPAFVITKDHKVMYWNKALEELSGIKTEEVMGTNQHWKAFYSEKRPCMADLLVDGEIDVIPQWYEGKYTKSKLIEGAYEATDFFPRLGEGGRWLHFTAASSGTLWEI